MDRGAALAGGAMTIYGMAFLCFGVGLSGAVPTGGATVALVGLGFYIASMGAFPTYLTYQWYKTHPDRWPWSL